MACNIRLILKRVVIAPVRDAEAETHYKTIVVDEDEGGVKDVLAAMSNKYEVVGAERINGGGS